jgi:(4-(4-[2-(gamma-L-glutamylamino)ethyl]phenoxymethyl)furan-2-yl)methanamine synthase
MSDDIIGWDIGGAHVKAARVAPDGAVKVVLQIPCALWRGLSELTTAIAKATQEIGVAPRHAVTMTGEMVDLFANRADGVVAIAATMQECFPNEVLRFYCGGGGFVAPDRVRNEANRIASANWRASVELTAKEIDNGLFIDIGSTTTDLIAIKQHMPHIVGSDDFTRLASGELVYSGVVRTPLMALGESVLFRGHAVPLMAEFFATTADVYRIVNQLPDGADQHPSADDAEKTAIASARRMARMIGRDLESAAMDDWHEMALAFRALQLRKIDAARRIITARSGLNDMAIIVGAGVGQFLTREIATQSGFEYRSFADLVSCEGVDKTAVANIAPAVAVALLALQQ